MKIWKRSLSLILAVLMVMGLVPATVFAASDVGTTTYVRVNSLEEIVPNARYVIAGVWTNSDGEDTYHLMGKDYRTVGGFHYSYAQDQNDVHYFDISQDLSTITVKDYSSILKVRLRPNGYYPDSYYFKVENSDGTESYLCGWSTSTNQGATGHDAHSCMPIYKNSYNTCGDAWWYLRMPTEGDYAGEWQIVSRCKFLKGGSSTYEYDVMQLRTPYPNSGGQFRAEEVYTRDVGEIADSERIKYTVDNDTNIWLFREVCSHKSEDVLHVSPKLPTCTTAGNVEYWFCKGCEAFSTKSDFSNSIGIADTFVAPTPHEGACGHQGVTKKFEVYKENYTSSDMHGEDFLLIGQSGEKYYAMGNVTNADGTRNAVEVSRNENGIITATSNHAEFLNYNWEDSPSGFTADGGVFSALDGRILTYDRSFYGTNTYVPGSARYVVDDNETGLGAFRAYSSRDTKDEYIVFDPATLTFKAQDTASNTTYLYRQLCGHEKEHFPANSSSCTRCGNIEYWYCDSCWKYFGAEDGSVTLEWGVLNSHATDHDYVDGICANCSKKAPVYTKVTDEDQFGQDGTYIIVATDGTNTYVLKEPVNWQLDLDGNGVFDIEEKDENGNEIPDIYETDTNGNDIPDVDEWDFVEPAVPVTPNSDGSISVLGLDAAEFEMIEYKDFFYGEGGEEVPMSVGDDFNEGDMPVGDESEKYYFYMPNGVLNGLNKPNTEFACFINGGELEAYNETSVWGVSLGNGLTSDEQQELGNAKFDVLADTAVMYAEFTGNGATRPLRLREYNGTTCFVSEYDDYLPGATEKVDGNGDPVLDEYGWPLYDTNDKQYGVFLYFAPNEYSHIHTWSDWEKTDDQMHTRSCSADGCTVKTETKPHSWNGGVETDAPTCTEDGKMTYTCTDCGAVKTQTIEKNGHTWSPWSYTDAGIHSRTCSVCDTAPETGSHTWGDWIKTDEETHQKTCSVCSGTASENHVWDAGVVTKEATDLEEGETTFTCTGCDHTKTEPIPKLPHTHRFGDWTPTMQDDTTHTRTCPCGEKETELHRFDNGEVINWATHLAPGAIVYTCTDCGFTYDDTLPALPDHEWGDWKLNPADETTHIRSCLCGEDEVKAHNYGTPVVTVEPTTESAGEKQYTCTDCGHTKTDRVDVIVPILPAEIVTTFNGDASLQVPEGSAAIVDKNATLVVDPCSEEEQEELTEKSGEKLATLLGNDKEIIVGYDVSLLMDDAPVQPGGKVLVTLPFEAKDFPYEELQVVFIDDEGNVTLCETFVTTEGYIAFYTDHFSTYAVVGKQTYVKGDVDGDSDVDLDDAIYFLFHVNFPEFYPVSQPVNFDGKGGVDLDDAIYFLFHVNFPEFYPLP